MKTIRQILFLSLSILVFFSCSSNRSDETPSETLVKANEYHQQSLDLREEVMEIEKKLQETGNDYRELNVELKTWDKDIIEVPGMEHSHDDTHRKYHVHNPPKQMTDEEHLNYQKMMYDEILEIRQKMVRISSPEVMG
jgi:hypothetical protein